MSPFVGGLAVGLGGEAALGQAIREMRIVKDKLLFFSRLGGHYLIGNKLVEVPR